MNTSALRINERPIYPLVLATWLLLALPVSGSAEVVAGRVVSSMGDVTAVRPDESARSLGRGEPVYAEDTLRTGQRGRAQIRLIDDGLLDLRPLSRLTIDSYEESGPDEDESGSAVMSFLRGAMRTVSGRIGRDPEDEYRMETPTATVGIRGTDYSLQYCDADCADPGAGRPEGLYGRVDNGTVDVTNAAGTGVFDDGDYFYVADDDTLPTQLIAPPPGILDGSDDGQAPEDDDEDPAIEDPDAALTRDDDDPELEVSVGADEFTSGDDNPDPGLSEPVVSRVAGGATLFITPSESLEVSGRLAREFDGSPAGFVLNDDDQIIRIDYADGSSVTVDDGIATHGNGSSFTAPDNFEVVWGEWQAAFNGSADGIDFTDATGATLDAPAFHYIYSEDVSTPEQIAGRTGTGTFDFNLGPALLSNESNNWSIDNMVLNVDFSAITAELDLRMCAGGCFNSNAIEVDVDTDVIDVDSLNLLEFDFDGDWIERDGFGDIDGSGNVAGSLSGQFVGVTAEGVIVSFSVERIDGGGNTVEEILGTRMISEFD